jgi:ribonuclease-3
MDGKPQGETSGRFLQALISNLGVIFNNQSLLLRALTHRSYYNEHPEVIEDNERLEFLGDAVLDFLIASWLYHKFPEMAEGQLTRLRSALVGNEQLAEFSRHLGVGSALLLGKGEAEGGGRNRTAMLGSTFEAIVGALYLDQGLEAVQKLVLPLAERVVVEILQNGNDLDPKSQLQEWSQANGLGTPIYRTVDSFGPDHEKIFIVDVVINHKPYARGRGHSKQEAAKDAAIIALQEIDRMVD